MNRQQHVLGWLFLVFLGISCRQQETPLAYGPSDLVFDRLAATWDEGIPLGNGMLGALIWEKDGRLRFSLDRADLWDLRPMENLRTPEWSFQWVRGQWEQNTYAAVQEWFDKPYDELPAPTKIPGGALEFELNNWGEVDTVRLFLQNAVCEVQWADGKKMQTFVQADAPVGWFRFEGVPDGFIPQLLPPEYQDTTREQEAINSLTGQNLQRLGYTQGTVVQTGNSATYTQEGWGGFRYQIHLTWEKNGSEMTGCWSISAEYPGRKKSPDASVIVAQEGTKGFAPSFAKHNAWWAGFWKKSTLRLPDRLLENQWFREQYKFGSAARGDAPPISLQAVWTADNGKIPPWKGDFHHDLNTQLSYWPAYSGNHLDLEEGFINWLWEYRDTFEAYTKTFYGTNGWNVPGVTTLTGAPMGGWIQYSFGPTVSAWLAHHFYLHWQYSQDRDFLENRAYPWISAVAVHLEELSVRGENGLRKLPLSSSPEIFNNSREAWFDEITNYDLALIRWTFEKASELARALGKNDEAEKWTHMLSEWPQFAVDAKEGLLFSKSTPYRESHRHFSHLLAIHPLGLIDWSQGEADQEIIRNTIANLTKYGPGGWTGYSYSWLGNLKARAMDGQGAAQALRIFAEAFCLPNSFHVNGDQTGKGYSNFTYRPFTLEGNFAFAAGIQEMLLQSHTGIIHIFPAIPPDWKDVSFTRLRAVGAFLISATLEAGELRSVEVFSEKGGSLNLRNTFPDGKFDTNKTYSTDGDIIILSMAPGERILLSGTH